LNNFYLNLGIEYRMSWWPMHYLFLFLLGGVVATKYEQATQLLQKHIRLLGWLLLATLTAMLAHYYLLISQYRYTLLQAVNTVHQLSPSGVLYSVAASLYLTSRFAKPLPRFLGQLFSVTGKHSYSVFLFHPFFLHYLNQEVLALGWTITVPVAIALYVCTIITSLAAASGWERLCSK
jgi:peptidoglycan/LPS O-acetylase OafA/YrhL